MDANFWPSIVWGAVAGVIIAPTLLAGFVLCARKRIRVLKRRRQAEEARFRALRCPSCNTVYGQSAYLGPGYEFLRYECLLICCKCGYGNGFDKAGNAHRGVGFPIPPGAILAASDWNEPPDR